MDFDLPVVADLLRRQGGVVGRDQLPAAGGIEVAGDWSRQPTGPPGVVVRRTRCFQQRVVWAADPPTLLPEHAVIDVAGELLAREDVAAAYSLVANSRDRVSIWRVRAALEERERVGHRGILAGRVGRPGAPVASAPPASRPWAHSGRVPAADRGCG